MKLRTLLCAFALVLLTGCGGASASGIPEGLTWTAQTLQSQEDGDILAAAEGTAIQEGPRLDLTAQVESGTITLTKEEAGQAAVQAMEQSQKNTARRYLKLFRWLLTGIGVWCLLSCLPWGTILLAQILPSTSIGVIGGADGPTQIYVSASDTAFPPQFYLLTQLAALIVCIVLAVQVWRLERRLK